MLRFNEALQPQLRGLGVLFSVLEPSYTNMPFPTSALGSLGFKSLAFEHTWTISVVLGKKRKGCIPCGWDTACISQRVQLEYHHGARSQKPYITWFVSLIRQWYSKWTLWVLKPQLLNSRSALPVPNPRRKSEPSEASTPEGPGAQYLRSLVPNTIPLMVVGTKRQVLGTWTLWVY